MSNAIEIVDRDERTVAAENVAYKWTCHALVAALIIAFAYRSMLHGQLQFDLLAIILSVTPIRMVFQASQNELPPGEVKKVLLIASIVAVVVAIGIVTFRYGLWN